MQNFLQVNTYNNIAGTQLTLLFVWEVLFLRGIGSQSDDRPKPMVLFKATLWMAVMPGSSTNCEVLAVMIAESSTISTNRYMNLINP